MIARELLKSQQVLNIFSASKNTNDTTQTQSFENVLNQKRQPTLTQSSDVRDVIVKSPVQKRDEPTQEVNQDSKSSDEVAKAHDVEQKTSEPQKVADESEDSELPTDEELNLMAFKELLKKKTGLSDDEVDQLLTLLGAEFQELVASTPVEALGEMDFSNLVKASNVLQNMEVNQLLQEPVDEMLTSTLNEQLKSFVQMFSEKIVSLNDNATPEKSTETIVTTMLDNVDTLTASMQENDQKSLKQILNEMNKNQSPQASTSETADKDAPIKASGDVSVTEVKSDIENENNMKSSSTEQADSKANQEERVTTEVSVEVDDNDMVIQQQSQDQKNVEATLKNVEIRQMPKQEIFSQVMDGLKGNLTVNELGSHLSIKLQPEQLGGVELKLTMHKGVVLAEIKVENETVKAAIETNLDQLKQSLTQKGYQTSGISVSVDSGKKENEQASQNQQYQLKRKVNDVVPDEASTFLEKIALNYNDDMVDATSTIDFFG